MTSCLLGDSLFWLLRPLLQNIPYVSDSVEANSQSDHSAAGPALSPHSHFISLLLPPSLAFPLDNHSSEEGEIGNEEIKTAISHSTDLDGCGLAAGER